MSYLIVRAHGEKGYLTITPWEQKVVFDAIGLFDTQEQAERWGKNNLDHDQWRITEIYRPNGCF